MAEVKIMLNGHLSTDLCARCRHSRTWHPYLVRCTAVGGCDCLDFLHDFCFLMLDENGNYG